jgi:hypothetical protein
METEGFDIPYGTSVFMAYQKVLIKMLILSKNNKFESTFHQIVK